MKRVSELVAAAIVTVSSSLAAQELRGTVRDSASGLPIPGAVVIVVNGADSVLARNITSELGQYRVQLSAAARRVRLLRIGFRSAEFDVSATGATVQRDFAMTTVPTLLGQVTVKANAACAVRRDETSAASLLDQARAGLLATIVARESKPASVVRVAYLRTLTSNGDSIVSQSVRAEHAEQATVSFNASHTALDFVNNGFRNDSAGVQTFFGPDADVLLDDNFARGYCFQIMPAVNSRPHQVGLGFSPANRRRGRVDINGSLWVDTLARTLKDIEFTYSGLDQLSEGFGAGGSISFRAMTTGIVLIDKWTLRLVSSSDTTVFNGKAPGGTTRGGYLRREAGGELARATWADGFTYVASLGKLQLTAVDRSGKSLPGVAISLANTDYRGVTDSLGRATIPDLVPGPYAVQVVDPTLASLAFALPTAVRFTARRSSISILRLETPTAHDFVADECGKGRRDDGSAWLIGRVTSPNYQPIANAQWKLRKSASSEWVDIADRGVTGSNGLFHYCQQLSGGDLVEVRAVSDGYAPGVARQQIKGRLTALRVELLPLVVARARDGSGATPVTQTVTITGIVTDSVSGLPVPGARISLMGSLLEAESDSSGRFLIGGIARGDYTLQVNTTSLDSLGAVKRMFASFTDSVANIQLVVPTVQQIATTLCGANEATGVLVGRLTMVGDSAVPAGVRVVAQWSDDKSRHSEWSRTRIDEQGTYRMCGVPVNTAIVVSIEVDSGATITAAPVNTTIRAEQRFARADLTLNKAVAVVATYTGIVTDSSGAPLQDADVSLPELKRSALTNSKGAFRFADVPVGSQSVMIKRIGFAAVAANVNFGVNQTVDHRITLKRAVTLNTVAIVDKTSPSETFDQHRKLGLGSFVTREEIEKNLGRRPGDIISKFPSVGVARGTGGQAWIAGRRAPAHLLPGRKGGLVDCGYAPSAKAGAAQACSFNAEDLARQNIYCPNGAESRQGLSCACYARVYVDDKLMNGGQPTEPFDINSIPTSQVYGMEFYASAAQTPAKYSALTATCGVVLIWTQGGP